MLTSLHCLNKEHTIAATIRINANYGLCVVALFSLTNIDWVQHKSGQKESQIHIKSKLNGSRT